MHAKQNAKCEVRSAKCEVRCSEFGVQRFEEEHKSESLKCEMRNAN